MSIDCSTKFDAVKPGQFIVYTEGSEVIIQDDIVCLSLKMDFAVAKCSPSSLFTKVHV